MSVRVVSGEIRAKTATTRVVIPTVAQPRWPPFERVAETIATPQRRFPPHRHEGVEVLTYVVEGSGSHEFESHPPTALVQGSTFVLAAPTPVSHTITPGKGQTVRWFAVVAALPPGKLSAPRLQSHRAEPTAVQADGTTVRHLVGPSSPLTSLAGLESQEIVFRAPGTSFRKVGHDRIAVCYAFSGRGAVDNEGLDAGEAALVEEAGGIAIAGQTGFHVVLVSAPQARERVTSS